MVEVDVITRTTFRISLPVNSFKELLFDNMTIEKSDKLAKDEIAEKYGVEVDTILAINPIKK